jgi:hypothetical protein
MAALICALSNNQCYLPRAISRDASLIGHALPPLNGHIVINKESAAIRKCAPVISTESKRGTGEPRSKDPKESRRMSGIHFSTGPGSSRCAPPRPWVHHRRHRNSNEQRRPRQERIPSWIRECFRHRSERRGETLPKKNEKK